jgi:hypothetical protein
MKLIVPLFALSLVANATLLGLWLLRPHPAAPAPGRAAAAPPAAPRATGTAKAESILTALSSGDSAALAAAGVAPEVIRQLAAARAFGRLAKIAREIDGPPDRETAGEFWRSGRTGVRPPPTREQRAERYQAEREFNDAIRAAFGDAIDFDSRARSRTFLSAEKQDLIRRIERDYEEMMREINESNNGVQLPADREKLKLLEAEKERDLAAALSPAERTQIELRTSRSAQAIIGRYGDAIANEAEYQRLYAIQKNFDDQYNSDAANSRPRTPDEIRQRAEAERKLNDDLRAALGEERWAQTSRAADGEYRMLGDLANRLNLAPHTPDSVYAVRDTYAAQSVALQQNPVLSAEERRKQFASLAARARADLNASLGPDGAEAYANRAAWLRLLQNGTAFTTDPRALPPGSPRPNVGSTVYPLPPPRPASPAAPAAPRKG